MPGLLRVYVASSVPVMAAIVATGLSEPRHSPVALAFPTVHEGPAGG